MADYDNTRFEIDDYAAQALDAYSGVSADDADVVDALAQHVWDSFEDSSNDHQENFEDLRGYYDAADSWCNTVAEFNDEETREFYMIGRQIFTESLLDRAENLEELCDAMNAILADLEPGETMTARLNASNYTSLPSFGEKVPRDSVIRASFDYEQLIAEADDDSYKIVGRDDIDKAA